MTSAAQEHTVTDIEGICSEVPMNYVDSPDIPAGMTLREYRELCRERKAGEEAKRISTGKGIVTRIVSSLR